MSVISLIFKRKNGGCNHLLIIVYKFSYSFKNSVLVFTSNKKCPSHKYQVREIVMLTLVYFGSRTVMRALIVANV